MAFRSLFGTEKPVEGTKSHRHKKNRTTVPESTKQSKRKDLPRGCEVCPLHGVPGINPIMGTMHGRSILLIIQSPGNTENDEGRELLGPAGEFLWDELSRVGIKRKNVDLFNVVRCLPADLVEGTYNSYLKMRPPTPEEVRCCAIHTEEALSKHKAKQILIFGQIAAKAVLNTRSLPAQKTFWSEELNARVYLLDHPAFFVRGYGKGPRMDQFRSTLDRVATDSEILSHQGETISDQFAYIRQQDYRLVTTKKQALKAKAIIQKYAAKGYRISVDIEADAFPPDNKWRVLACGFCPKPGLSFVFVFLHKDQKERHGREVWEIAKSLLEDEAIEKVLQFGCSDEEGLLQENCVLKGYTHDTYLSEYLRFSDKKAYGLEAIAESRFPDFSGYKLIRVPEMITAEAEAWQEANPSKNLPAIFRQPVDVQSKYLDSHKMIHIRHLSLETLRLYNGADCDLCKRIERSNKNKVPQALMNLYIDLGRLLYKMDPAGPLFDYEQHEKMALVTPKQADAVKAKLRKIIKNKKFNPGSTQQVYNALYGKLDLEYPLRGEPNTRKMALLMLGRKHEFPRLVLEWRKLDKAKSILASYKRSADAHEGRLRTKWKATGTRTGRLSAGSERNLKDATIINLQNIKRDPQIQNMCVADTRWRQVFNAIAKIIRLHKTGRARRVVEWIKKHMPDLMTYVIYDYGQVEVRVMAQISGDKHLKQDCASADIHTTVGSVLTGWDVERIKNDEATRTLTKNCIAAGQLVLTDHGLVPIEDVKLWMKVWDGEDFVCHEGVIYKGRQEVITYDGLTATPDHGVYTAEGKQATFASIAEAGARLRGTFVTHSCAKVYDIVNAGPRHRFTVSEHLVSNCHFGILFGIGKANLFEFVVAMSPPDMRDRVTREQVEESYDNYFRRYPGVQRFIDKQRIFAKEHGYVETIFGMIQTLNITEENKDVEYVDEDEMGGKSSYWGNQAINGPVQGSAHQLMICALVNLLRKAKKYALLGIPPMEVHDAIYVRVPVLQLPEAVALGKYLLEQESLKTVASDFPDIKWDVPIVVDAKAGIRLGTKVKVNDANIDVGQFMLDWYKVCKEQDEALDKQLEDSQ